MARLALHSPNLPKPLASPTVCCIYPHHHDKLRLINFPANLLPAFRIAVQTSWNKGIQSEGRDSQELCYEVKLRGTPWALTKESHTAVRSCRLTSSIMRFMLAHGWGLELSSHLQFKDRWDSWFFRKVPQETNVMMCGISFGSSDKIRVIDGSSDVIQAVRSTIQSHWYRGLQRQRVHCEAEEFKLKGRPWQIYHDNTHASALIMCLIDALKIAGWSLYASVGTATFGRGGMVMDAWILKKSKP